MSNVTTIQITKEALKSLKEIKEHPRQTYSELILKLSKVLKQAKTVSHYDRFLHEVQKSKMKELWNNSEDEAWEHA